MGRKIEKPSLFESKVITELINQRKARKITQIELAQRLNTTQSVISGIENLSSSPTLRYLNQIAEAMDLEIVIGFQPREKERVSDISIDNRVGYICLNCLHEWQSDVKRTVIQCPECHQRQGVSREAYQQTWQALDNLIHDVMKSPPPLKPPPVNSLRENVPAILRIMREWAFDTFPSPRLPFKAFRKLMEQVKSQKANKDHQFPHEDDNPPVERE